MYTIDTYADILLHRLHTAIDMHDAAKATTAKHGEIVPPNTYAAGYALGYAHALAGAYDALPDYITDREVTLRAPAD